MRYVLLAVLLVAVATSAMASTVLFDRGLPSINLNYGADRSNVCWAVADGTPGFTGDDFVIGSEGQYYVIDSITVWGIQVNPLSSDINNIWLYLGETGTEPALRSFGAVVGNTNSNPDITHEYVTYPGGVDFYLGNGGTQYSICQTTFGGLHYVVKGGVKYNFGVRGDNYLWWNHASNAALSGTTQNGADGLYYDFKYDLSGNYLGAEPQDTSINTTWDKVSDINVKVAGDATTTTLSLNAVNVYVKPIDKDASSTVTVKLDVAGLQQEVSALQAMLNFSSTYFSAAPGDVSVGRGGGVWDEVIYNSWNVGGDLDVAVGVNMNTVGGTTADATTATITLKPIKEGQTRLVFRPDLVPDPGLTGSTYISTVGGAAIWPAKIDSANIYIDGTAPAFGTVSPIVVPTDPGVAFATVAVATPGATDENSGVDTVTGVRDDGLALDATYPLGDTKITWTATDKCGNSATVEQTVTVKDEEAPDVTSATAAPDLVKAGQTVTITVAGTDNVGITAWQHRVAPSTTWVDGVGVPASELAEGPNTLYVQATDAAGNVKELVVTPVVNKDTIAPAITEINATQGGASVLSPASAVQGIVDIYVTATHSGAASFTAPTVDVADIGPAALAGQAGDVYHFTIAIGPAVVDGSHMITVTAVDGLGNTSTDATKSIGVDKNQITGQIQLEDFVGASRKVTFVATSSTGAVLKTWSEQLVTGFAGSIASFTLTNVPAGTANLSAKTAWTLRSRVACPLDGNLQGIANFTGADKLLGGDINGTNSINVLDYSIMKTSWGAGLTGDVNGDNETQLLDYDLMKRNWFKVGDAL